MAPPGEQWLMPIVVGVRARAAFGLDHRRTDARWGQSRDEAVKDLILPLRRKEGEVLESDRGEKIGRGPGAGVGFASRE